MENNPYAAPGAVVDDVSAFGGNDLEARKATRGQRLGAAMLDNLIIVLCVVPIVLFGIAYNRDHAAVQEWGTAGIVLVFLGLILLLGIFVYNCILLSRNGQTIGKRLLKIKIVRADGTPVTLSRVIFLRWLPLVLLGMIPFIGRVVGLVDALLIFRAERRCLHDNIADTIVIAD
jgi:uncharacterized RDD family membrane protein YckC